MTEEWGEEMERSEIFLIIGMVILTVAMCIYYAKSRRRFTKLFFGALTGAGALYLAHLILAATGYILSMNLFTFSVAAIMGIPGVLLLTVAQFL